MQTAQFHKSVDLYVQDCVVAFKSIKTKEKSSWVVPKVVAVAPGSGLLQEIFIAKFKLQFKRCFANMVVTT